VGNSEGGSPRYEQRCGGRASVVQNQRRRCLVEAALEREEKRREEKRGLVRCGVTRGWCSPFVGAGGGLGVEMPASNGRRFTAEPLMAGEGGINGDSRGNRGGE
jgi:hypothetical protein